VYLAEKNTFLEFFDEDTMTAKQQACGRRSSSKDGYLNAFSANAVSCPDLESTINPSSEDIVTPDSTPRWHNIYHYPVSDCIANKVSVPNLKLPIPHRNEMQTPDSTPRWNVQYQFEKEECINQKPTVLPDEEMQDDDTTPRWCNMYKHDDASCQKKTEVNGEARRASWADQSEVLTPDSTPRWTNAYGYESACNTHMHDDANSKNNVLDAFWQEKSYGLSASQTECANAESTTPRSIEGTSDQPVISRCNATAFMNMTPMPPSPTTEIEELKQRLAALESENLRLKATEGSQSKPQSCSNKLTAAAPVEDQKALTISLDMLLLGGLKQSAGGPTKCAASSECKESNMHVQPQRVNTSSKKQGKKAQNVTPIPAEGATTMMMRGIPCGLTAESLISIIDDAGFKGKYNFFYLPTDSKKNANLGYCFINFIDVQSAEHSVDTFKGVRLLPSRSPKTCSVSPASIQGLTKLSQHFKHTAKGANGPFFLNN
jgi:hypothetical protein